MKVAIFYTDHDNEWTKPYGNFVDMCSRLLNSSTREKEMEYIVYNSYGGEIPSYLELAEDGIDNILITGSRYDSFDRSKEWINKLRDLIYEIVVTNGNTSNIRLCGICFGHQIIANALNYEVKRNPLGDEFGLFEITLNETGLKLFEDIIEPGDNKLMLAEFHSDIVTCSKNTDGDDDRIELENWGSTDKSPIQGFYLKNKLLTFQGHPEFTNEVVLNGLKFKVRDENKVKAGMAIEKNHGVSCNKIIMKLFEGKI
ncbi:hypothetical protein TPHA_0A01570 [Tetrapisispora phaffii CBS 4417]|uniref:Glutamine amidotransferase domain-containing protein n=1 Tax=Tetrapisispora phaffii (strain ATCC 24235 / CBS 4417 / NBRC 1672 / NRRL Y-8282 / UCD 70-5) TaxID=1071381 RepID=G8BMW2_TETPH|nr:hypothetical protein TPHA_0A01570 [Tetrapisispora phaffii CBS 4417]CCE61240.1 hypothetical protein TPHA_0A01570 [Tetrapisispora phaffii CBS 4417]